MQEDIIANITKVKTMRVALMVLFLQSLSPIIGFIFPSVQCKAAYDPHLQKAAKATHTLKTTVPSIARLLGVRIGYNGQKALERQFGPGIAVTGGHPGGRKLWHTRHPSGQIETDGFNYNNEDLVLESLYWGLDTTVDPKVPRVRRLPRHPGWLGTVNLGMTPSQVSRLTADGFPAPQKAGDVWTWKAKGFVRPNRFNTDIYTKWTAKLTFHHGRLVSIDVKCD